MSDRGTRYPLRDAHGDDLFRDSIGWPVERRRSTDSDIVRDLRVRLRELRDARERRRVERSR